MLLIWPSSRTDGSQRIFKRPMRAHERVYAKPFQELLGQVDNETTILMGHTRWRTRGNEFNNRNNHPIRAGIAIGTHNGTIYNADYLFRRLGLPRYAEVGEAETGESPVDSHSAERETQGRVSLGFSCEAMDGVAEKAS